MENEKMSIKEKWRVRQIFKQKLVSKILLRG